MTTKGANQYKEASEYIDDISEFDIYLVDMNPSINWFQKWRLKRRLRKNLKEALKNGRESQRSTL